MNNIEILFQLISASIVTFAFAILFNIKGRILIYTSIAGGISWLVHLILKDLNQPEEMGYFIAAIIIGVYAEVVSKEIKTTATTIMIPALIPLAPGGGIYYTMLNLIEKDYDKSLHYGIQTLLLAGAMALGIVTAITIFKVYKNLIEVKKS